MVAHPIPGGQHPTMPSPRPPKTPSTPPAFHQQFVRRFPRLGQAWDLVNEEGDAGPLDVKTQRLLKLAIAVGAMREGAVHAGVRKARDAGATTPEMEQVVALAASTIGLPSAVAAWSWVTGRGGRQEARAEALKALPQGKRTRPAGTRGGPTPRHGHGDRSSGLGSPGPRSCRSPSRTGQSRSGPP